MRCHEKVEEMSKKVFFSIASFIAILLVAPCASVSFAAHGGGGGGGHGGGGGGGHGGGGGFSGGRGGGGGQSAYGGSGTSHSANYGSTAGNGWNGRGGNWGGYFGQGGYGGWGGGWGLGLGLGLNFGGGYPYDYGYSYPGAGDYYYSYGPSSYDGSSAVPAPVVAGPQQLPASTAMAPTASEDQQQDVSEALQYYSEARAAFLQGDYRNALRLAGHAGVEAPQNAKVHELISLALFASGNYPAAASEAHAATALGTIADWNDLYGYYNNVEKYTTQMRALENASTANPKDAAEHFLLGYHYLMTGARDNAKTEFAEAVKLTPGDKLAGHYLQQLQSNVPLTPPQMASKPQGKSL